MAKNPMIEKMRKKAVDKAMGKGKDEEKDEPKDEMPEGGADEAPEEGMEAAGEGGVPPQVKEALSQLPVPALKAVREEIDRILAETEGGEGPADDMGADMGGAPPAPMGGDMGGGMGGAPIPGM